SGSGFPLDALDDFFWRSDILEIEANQALTEIQQVGMRINDAGQQRSAVEVQRAGGGKTSGCLFVGADPKDAIASDGHRLSRRKLAIHSNDVSVADDQVGGLGLRACRV